MRLVRLGLVLLLVVLAAAGCKPSTTTITDQEAIAEKAIGFVSVPFQDDYGLLRVPGYVDNLSDSEFRAVTLEITLLDEDGNKKEKITHVLENIPPKTRKTFDLNAGPIPPGRTATIAITSLEVVN